MKKIIAAILLTIMLTSCSNYNDARGRGDAPVGSYDDSKAEVINFPDHFMNVATKCNHGNRIYAHTRVAAPVIIAHDPTCPQDTSK